MGIVSGTFQVAGQSACLTLAGDVSHSSPEAHGIGTHHALLLALVAQDYHAIVIAALVELEVSQIYPSASTHLLVDQELGHASLVEDQILGIAHTLGERLVGHIYGISSRLGNVGNPLGKGTLGLLFRLGEPGGTFLEGVLSVDEDLSLDGEACLGCGLGVEVFEETEE